MSTNSKKDSSLRLSKSRSRIFILSDKTPFIITEAYNTARTNLVFSLSTSTNKTVTVTSYSPAEGKTTTAVNLAITMASTDSKVLLIDSDMRKPFIHTLLRLKKNIGLSTILSGMCPISQGINKNVRPNLDVIVAGPIPPNPSELISSPNTKKFLEILSNTYDYIIIDTPPIGVVTDSMLYNEYVAGSLLVIREGWTRHPDIVRAMQKIKLANGNPLGFIKNGCNANNKKSSYYYYDYNYSYSNNNTETKNKQTTK